MAQDRRAIESAKALARDLELLGKEVSTKLGRKANKAAADRLAQRLIAVAPRDTNGPTKKYKTLRSGAVRTYFYGAAHDNIKVRFRKARNQGHIVAHITAGNAFWLTFYEFGTVTQPARPFWRPAAETLRDEMIEIQVASLRAGIDKQVAKTRRAASRWGAVNATGRNG